MQGTTKGLYYFAKKSQKYHDRNLEMASKNENPRKRPENKVINCKLNYS